MRFQVTLPFLISDEGRKLTHIFIFTLLCGASKGFMKALKAFIKLFEAPQRRMKTNIQVNFYFSRTFSNAQGGKG